MSKKFYTDGANMKDVLYNMNTNMVSLKELMKDISSELEDGEATTIFEVTIKPLKKIKVSRKVDVTVIPFKKKAKSRS